MITLTLTGIYKDGGSKSFIDAKGRHYWRCFGINDPDKGKVFMGSINDMPRKLAIGTFHLVEDPMSMKTKLATIIKQEG